MLIKNGVMGKAVSLHHPARIIIISFLFGITIGGFLLKLPQATTGEPLNWVDAFFTSTSAICVTGLIVVDTGTKFSVFGQGVILFLIQLGGLGIMVFSAFFIMLFGRNLSLRDRFMAKESLLGQISYKKLFSVLKYIMAVTFSVELIGAVVLFLRFKITKSTDSALYDAVFHSVSAYCNAGFSLYRNSLMGFSGDYVINFTMMILIVLGGLGFPVLYELIYGVVLKKQGDVYRLSLHCKIVLITTASLLLTGTIFLYLLELKNSSTGGSGLSILEALFHSVTARTAGFNTVELRRLSNPALFFLIMFMFIGGSPASTAGGIKTTTFAIFLGLIWARFRGRDRVELFHRTLPNEIIYKVLSIIVGSLFLIICVNIILQVTEFGFLSHEAVKGSFLMTLFETVSAFGTVGLSMGLTPSLTFVGKFIIMGTMLIGRIGPLTFVLALIYTTSKQRFEYPEDGAMVG